MITLSQIVANLLFLLVQRHSSVALHIKHFIWCTEPLRWRSVVVTDRDVCRSGPNLHHQALPCSGWSCENSDAHGEKEKARDFLVHSFFLPIKFSFLSACEKLQKSNRDLLPGLNHRGGTGSSKTKKIEQIKDNIDCLLLCLFSNYCV